MPIPRVKLGYILIVEILEDTGMNAISEETKEKMRKAHSKRANSVCIDNVVFPSVSEASRQLKTAASTIRKRLKSKNFPDWNYKGSPLANNERKKVFIGEREFDSMTQATQKLGMSHRNLLHYLRSDRYPEYRYVGTEQPQ